MLTRSAASLHSAIQTKLAPATPVSIYLFIYDCFESLDVFLHLCHEKHRLTRWFGRRQHVAAAPAQVGGDVFRRLRSAFA